MMLDFHKIRRLPPYVFEQVNVTKAGLRANGADVIDLGMGNPDLPTPPHIVEKLRETALNPDVHGYSASRGIMGLRKALVGYYGRRFGVKLDPAKEVVVTLGSKEGFANLAQAIAAPGDTIIVPNPSYPLHSFGFIMAGASIRSVEAHSPEQYLSNLGRAVRHSIPSPTADVSELRAAAATGLIDGVTTNPTLIAKSGRKMKEAIAEICSIIPGPVSAEAVATDVEGMLAEGRYLARRGLRRGLHPADRREPRRGCLSRRRLFELDPRLQTAPVRMDGPARIHAERRADRTRRLSAVARQH